MIQVQCPHCQVWGFIDDPSLGVTCLCSVCGQPLPRVAVPPAAPAVAAAPGTDTGIVLAPVLPGPQPPPLPPDAIAPGSPMAQGELPAVYNVTPEIDPLPRLLRIETPRPAKRSPDRFVPRLRERAIICAMGVACGVGIALLALTMRRPENRIGLTILGVLAALGSLVLLLPVWTGPSEHALRRDREEALGHRKRLRRAGRVWLWFGMSWRYFRQGDLTERELVSDFVDHLDQAAMASQWEMLPGGYQEVVRQYFRANKPGELPYLVFGQVTPQQRQRFQEKAEALAAFLRGG